VTHTPGPWRIEQGVYIMPPENSTQFSICKMGGIQREESRKANARLIAAAPELLEACKALLLALDGDGEMAGILDTTDGYYGWGQVTKDIRDAAYAAIAKAEGRK
jgi:hypothetical protein